MFSDGNIKVFRVIKTTIVTATSRFLGSQRRRLLLQCQGFWDLSTTVVAAASDVKVLNCSCITILDIAEKRRGMLVTFSLTLFLKDSLYDTKEPKNLDIEAEIAVADCDFAVSTISKITMKLQPQPQFKTWLLLVITGTYNRPNFVPCSICKS